ncbi:MAG: 50S ribosomal protein L9 [Fibrobacterota bacterium]|jgi:large subunit ribosomal protein L9
MKVILIKDYPRLGSKYDVVEVKRGFARNYLVPEGIAQNATKGNLRHAEEMKKYSANHEEKVLAKAEADAEKMADISLTFKKKAKGDSDVIYGSVSASDIVDALEKEGITVHASSVMMAERIKKVGVYDIRIKLHKNVDSELKVWVVKEEA